MTEKKSDNRKLLCAVLLLLLYVAVNTALILRHENWRDEAQAWQIAKLLNLKELFAQLKYEGHPCLWYLILIPFAKLGMPFGVMNYISLFFMAVAAWLLLRKAPFGMPVKILLLCSGFFTYYYPVISRSYALVPFLLALQGLFYPRRQEKPLQYGVILALLTQTHIYMIGLSFALSFFWACENLWGLRQRKGEKPGAPLWKRLTGVSLNLLSALFLIWELLGSTERNTGVNIHISSTLSSNLHRISVAGQWAAGFAVGQGIDDETWKKLVFLMAVCFVAFLIWSWKEALMLATAVGSQLLLFTYVYLPSEQKAILMIHELIFLLWLACEPYAGEQEKRSRRQRLNRFGKIGWQVLLAVLCIISIDGYCGAVTEDWTTPYSAGKDAAAYLREHVDRDAVVVAAGDVPAFSVAAYAPQYTIWYPVTEAAVGFSVWDESRQETISCGEMLTRIREHYPGAKEMILLTGGQNNVEGLEELLGGLTPEFSEDAKIREESVKIYRLEI